MKNEKMKKWRNRLGKAIWMLSAAICIGIGGSSAVTQAAEEDVVTEGEVAINEANFPDKNFREYVKEFFDTDRNEILSTLEREDVTGINLYGQHTTTLEGIKNFPNLKAVWIRYENLQELDLSGMTNLRSVYCWHNSSLTEVNVSGCSALTKLEFDEEDSLIKLNATDCKKLERLEYYNHELQKLDVTGCSSLNKLNCEGNNLKELDLTGCTALKELLCSGNELQELDLTGCTALKELRCYGNELQELDLTRCTALEKLFCSVNKKLQKLNITGCNSLSTLYCENNGLKKLDVSGHESLKTLLCECNGLQEVNVSGCFNLEDFRCNNNDLKEIHLTDCEKLRTFYCGYNKLTKLDLNACKSLYYLDCDYNELTELDITNCTALSSLSCCWNNLTELKMPNLTCVVYAEGNYIDEEKTNKEYFNPWIIFPMKKYIFMGDFSKTTTTIPYTDLGLNLYKSYPYMGCCIQLGDIIKVEGMTYSDEAEAFYIEPFEKEKTVSFTYNTFKAHETIEMRLINMNFEDIRTKDWFFEPVVYVYENDLMTGMNETAFAPADTLARAQFAVILHRMNGKPAMEYTERFPDVEKGIWYTDAILWASQAKVVNGYSSNGYFGPADKITREQMAAMMYRYADFKGYDTSARKELDAFKDAADVNAYALDAMQWAVGNEIITGKTIDGQLVLDPEGYANRAECAAIIMRFTEKYKE